MPCSTVCMAPSDSVCSGRLVPVPSDRYERYHASAPRGTNSPLQRYHRSDILRYDMVIGDRLSSTYFKENKRPFHGVGNLMVRYLINRFFQSNVRDIMTGYRAFSRLFVKNIPILSKSFEIETEMTLHALDKNYRIAEVPITYRDRPIGSLSKLSTFKDGMEVIAMMFRLFRDYKPFLFFSIISVVVLLIAIALFIPVFIDYLHTGLVLRFPTLIVSCFMMLLAMLLFVCGLILEVIANKNKQLYELLLHRQ